VVLEKIRRKNRNTFSASRKIDAAISGAEPGSFERRSRWKSNMIRPAKITRPSRASCERAKLKDHC
jgi:hypothetical protein